MKGLFILLHISGRSKAESKVLGSIDEKSSVMQEQREEGFG